MFGSYRSLTRFCASITALCALALSSARHVQAAEDFAGKEIRMIVPAGPAGGYGLYGELAARHLGRFIPGHPAVVVSYMPGAAGLLAMNYLYGVAPRDGTVMAVMAAELAYQQALRTNAVRYDASKFNYIGRATTSVPVHMVWHTAPAQSIEELKMHEVVTGAVGSVGTQNDLPRAFNALIGTKWKIIGGYKDNNQTRAAMERGEIQAAISPATLFEKQLKTWLKQGKVNVVVQYADFRHPSFPAVPTVVEVAENIEAKSVFKLLVSVATVGRAYGLPPDVPAERVAVLQKAFDAMMEDPAFRADAEMRGADLMPMSGDALTTYIRGIVGTSPDIVEKTRAITGAK